jgi:2-methylcitrate dehydratase PrpD
MYLGHRLIKKLREYESQAVSAEDNDYLHTLLKDWLGCVMGGLETPSCQSYLTFMGQLLDDNDQSILGESFVVSSQERAMVYGVAAHELEWDDSEFVGETHPSAVVLSALFAVAQKDTSIDKLLSAARLGYAGLYLLGQIMNPGHYATGWHSSGTIGIFGATLALAFFEGLSDEQIFVALSAAGQQASGIQAVFGTELKSLVCGRASANAVLSVSLAKSGFSGAADIFEQEKGLLKLFQASGDVSTPLSNPINLSWIKLKEYPSCHCTHPAIKIGQQLKKKSQKRIVKSVTIYGSDYSIALTGIRKPSSREQAYFSLSYCFAISYLYRDISFEHFSDRHILSSAVNELEQ